MIRLIKIVVSKKLLRAFVIVISLVTRGYVAIVLQTCNEFVFTCRHFALTLYSPCSHLVVNPVERLCSKPVPGSKLGL